MRLAVCLLALLSSVTTLRGQDAIARHLSGEQKARNEKRFSDAEREGAAAVAEAEKLGPTDARLAGAVYESCVTYFTEKKYQDALPLCHRASELAQAAGESPAIVSRNLERYGWTLTWVNRHADAVPVFEEALAYRRRALGNDHIQNANLLYNLGWAQENGGQHSEAAASFRSALELQERLIGPDRLQTARTLWSLGQVLMIDGNYAEARTQFQRALQIREAISGPNDASVAEVLTFYGDSERRAGHNEDAEKLLRRAVGIAEKTEPGTVQLSDALNNLALALKNQRRYDEAEHCLLQALDLSGADQNSQRARVSRQLGNLAGVYLREGKLTDAEQAASRALTIREKALGEDNPALYSELYGMGDVYMAGKRYPEAEAVYRRLLRIQEKFYGPEHMETAHVLWALGRALAGENHFDEAEDTLRRGYQIAEKRSGAEGLETADAAYRLAACYRAEGRYRDAEPLMRRFLEIHESKDHDPAALATARNNFAVALREMGRYREAVEVQEKAVRAGDANQSGAAVRAANLGELYRLQGRYGEAEDLLLKSMDTADDSGAAIRLLRLSLVDYGRGRYTGAFPEMEKALALVPKDDFELQSLIHQQMANVKRDTREYSEAGRLYGQASALRQHLPAITPAQAVLQCDMSLAALRQGQLAEAGKLLAGARQILESTVGPDSAFMAIYLERLALLDRARRQYPEALAAFQQALATEEKQIGTDVPALAPVLKEYGETLRLAGRSTEAAGMEARAARLTDGPRR